MNIVLIASLVVAATVVIGLIVAWLFTGLSNVVTSEQESAAKEKEQIRPSMTKGFEIPVEADPTAQLKAARKLAAQRAALLPRGANLQIGGLGAENQPTAFDGTDRDPITAVKIATFHGWSFLNTGGAMAAQATAETASAKAPSETVAPVKSVDDLEPGKDYPYIEITDEMSPAEVRKARIANAKAKSAAVKALKESAEAAAPAAAPAAKTATAPSKKAEAPAKAVTSEPQPGVDYEVIEITDDMSPDEVRKARIANAKAKSAAMKKFKESGGGAATPSPAPEAVPAGQTDGQEADVAPAAEIPADIPKPEYIEITDDLDPADVRKARIQNAKARSAYHKALRDAGIDPATVED
jgi:hypothetical protein